MQGLKRLFKFYVDGSFHVAISVFCLTWVLMRLMGLNINFSILIFNGCSTLLIYNLLKYSGKQGWLFPDGLPWERAVGFWSGVAGLVAIYQIWAVLDVVWWVLSIAGVLTFLYARTIPGVSKTLRQIPGVKMLIVAIVWVLLTVLLPAVSQGIKIGKPLYVIGVAQLCFVIAITIPFEIRDLKRDSKLLGTLPQRIGVIASKITAIFLLMVYWCLWQEITINHVLLLVTILSIILVLFVPKRNNKYYVSFWIESIPIIWLIIDISYIHLMEG